MGVDRPVAPTFTAAVNAEDAAKGKIGSAILSDCYRPLTLFDFAYNLFGQVFDHSKISDR